MIKNKSIVWWIMFIILLPVKLIFWYPYKYLFLLIKYIICKISNKTGLTDTIKKKLNSGDILDVVIRKMFLKNVQKFLGIMLMFIIAISVFFTISISVNNQNKLYKTLQKDYNLAQGQIQLLNTNMSKVGDVAKYAQNYMNTNELITKITKTNDKAFNLQRVNYKVIDENLVFKPKTKSSISESKITDSKEIYTWNDNFSKNFIIDGKKDLTNNHILVSSWFSKNHQVKINDKITIANKKFIVSGIVGFPTNLSYSKTATNNRFIVSKANYDEIKGEENSKLLYQLKKTLSTKQFNQLRGEILDNEDFKIKLGTKTISPIADITSPVIDQSSGKTKNEDAWKTISFVFLVVLLTIIIIMFIIIITKIIDSFSAQIGILKALGYTNKEISSKFTMYPLVISVISIVIGFIIGIYVAHIISANIWNDSVGLSLFNIDWVGTIIICILPLIVIQFCVKMNVNKLLKRPINALMAEIIPQKNTKFSIWSKIIFENITSKLPIKSALRLKLLLSSPSKAIALFIGILFSTFIFTFVIFMSYNTIIGCYKMSNWYPQPVFKYDSLKTYPKTKENDNQFFYKNYGVESISRADKANISTYKDVEHLSKYDSMPLQLFVLNDKQINKFGAKKHFINNSQQGIVIAKGVQKKFKLNVGDYLNVFDPNNSTTSFKIKVAGFSDVQADLENYVTQSYFSKVSGINNVYNATYAKSNDDYSNIAKSPTIVNETTFEKSMVPWLAASSLFGFVVIFMFVVYLFILPIIKICSEFVIDENKANIALLRAIGYTNNEISSMMLNVYTFVVIFAIIVSNILLWNLTPSMEKGLLSTGINSLFAITPSIAGSIIGAILVFVIYLQSIKSTSKILNTLSISKLLAK